MPASAFRMNTEMSDRRLTEPYHVPDDPDEKEYQLELEEQHKKLAKFLKFKAQSKQLSRQFANMATAKNGKVPPVDTGSDSDGTVNDSAKKKRG